MYCGDLGRMSRSAERVLLCLMAHMQEVPGSPCPTWEAWPSIRTIAKWCDQTEDTVSRSLKCMKELGFLDYDGRGRRPDRFTIILPIEKLHWLPPKTLSSLRRTKAITPEQVVENHTSTKGRHLIERINTSIPTPPAGEHEKTVGVGIEVLKTAGVSPKKAADLLQPYADISDKLAKDATRDLAAALKARKVINRDNPTGWIIGWFKNSGVDRAAYHRSVIAAGKSATQAQILKSAGDAEERAQAVTAWRVILAEWQALTPDGRLKMFATMLKSSDGNDFMHGAIVRHMPDWKKSIEQLEPPESILPYWPFKTRSVPSR